MKITILHSIALCLLVLWPLSAKADRTSTPQEFNAMTVKGTITFEDDNRRGITDLVTYTCSGPTGTEFGLSGKVIAILLPQNGSTVTTTKIDNLVGLLISHNPTNQSCSNIKVSVSLDNENWILVSTPETYRIGTIDIPNFIHDSYYVKIANTSNTAVGIRSITYYRDDCNCFRYVSE